MHSSEKTDVWPFSAIVDEDIFFHSFEPDVLIVNDGDAVSLLAFELAAFLLRVHSLTISKMGTNTVKISHIMMER